MSKIAGDALDFPIAEPRRVFAPAATYFPRFFFCGSLGCQTPFPGFAQSALRRRRQLREGATRCIRVGVFGCFVVGAAHCVVVILINDISRLSAILLKQGVFVQEPEDPARR